MFEPVMQSSFGTLGSRLPFSALRILADDLTGALDTAAQFASPEKPICVALELPADSLPDTLVVDCATREVTAASAAAKAKRTAVILDTVQERLSFFKVDSLLRGNPMLELSECLKREPQRRCIIAPALPHQRRVTRAGKQFAQFFETWSVVGEDIAAALQGLGFSCTLACPGDPLPKGISLWDSESDADLDSIVQTGISCKPPILWCGSAGLAGALARLNPAKSASPKLFQPMLGIFGTNHAVMLDQLAYDAAFRISSSQYQPGRTAWVTFDLATGIDRAMARAQIDVMARDMLNGSPPPRTLVVSGGETLRGIAKTLHVKSLAVIGQLEPGIPVALLVGGPWNGTLAVTKSGAFGPPEFLTLLRQKAET